MRYNEMKKIESFCVDHNKLLPGLYVSRRDSRGGVTVTTFDLRFLPPNRAGVFGTGTMHTVEHIAATYLRNGMRADEIIYFGPMGCRTGFYLVMFGDLSPEDVYGLVCDVFKFTADFTGDIPGASPSECGNYSDQNLAGAKQAAAEYLEALKQKCFTYPE